MLVPKKFRLPEGMMEALEQEAAKRNKKHGARVFTPSYLVREAVGEFLKIPREERHGDAGSEE